MTALDVLRALARRWWVIVLVAVLAAASALLYSQSQPISYRAQAEVVVLPSRTAWELSLYLEARMRTFRAVLLSPPLAQAALEQNGLDLPPDDLLGRTYVQLDPDEGRIVIQVEDGDPARAAALANSLAVLLQEWVDGINASQMGIDHIYVAILSPARVPGAPSGPRTMVNTLAGAVLGGALGLPLAFLWDFLDGGLRDPERAAARLGMPAWPVLPPFPLDRVSLLDESESFLLAAFQRLYTYLRFPGLAGQPEDRSDWRVLALTGVQEEDLPPAFLANLGAAIAQGGSSVLLVDANYERPALHEPFALPAEPSLAAFLQDGGEGRLAPARTALAGLYLLPAGEALPAPAQASVLRRTAQAIPTLGQAAEVVLVRLPPILERPEALFLAAQADAALLVGRSGRTRLRTARRALATLEPARLPVLGLALWHPGRGR